MRPKRNEQKRLLIPQRKKKRPKMKMQGPKMKMLRMLRPNLLPLQLGNSSISRIASAIQDPQQVTNKEINFDEDRGVYRVKFEGVTIGRYASLDKACQRYYERYSRNTE